MPGSTAIASPRPDFASRYQRGRTRHDDVLLLCARIGFTPPR
ncbi:MAG TPA: hypothetical protein VEH84_13950 [Alphaproteobacteria bacterium]|nr:hypothetical protein [Alphaproteobacteria bacterium]